MCFFDAPDPTPPEPKAKTPEFITSSASRELDRSKKKRTGIDSLRVDLNTAGSGSGLAI